MSDLERRPRLLEETCCPCGGVVWTRLFNDDRESSPPNRAAGVSVVGHTACAMSYGQLFRVSGCGIVSHYDDCDVVFDDAGTDESTHYFAGYDVRLSWDDRVP